MAHFYGTLQGNRGEASRLGSKSAGLRTYAASWQGAVSVRLWYDDDTETDMVEVSLTRHRGAGVERVLYTGPVSGAAPVLKEDSVYRGSVVCTLDGTDDPKAERALRKRGEAYQPKTGARCSCRRGVQRDNCPTCEGTGLVIDFAAIRARRGGA